MQLGVAKVGIDLISIGSLFWPRHPKRPSLSAFDVIVDVWRLAVGLVRDTSRLPRSRISRCS